MLPLIFVVDLPNFLDQSGARLFGNTVKSIIELLQEMSHRELALSSHLVLHHCPARCNGLEFGGVGRCAYHLVPLFIRKFIKSIGWSWGYFLEDFHQFSFETILSNWDAILD